MYAFTKKCGFSAQFCNSWDELYLVYISFCKFNKIPIVESQILLEIVEYYRYYNLKFSDKLHYYIIKTQQNTN